MALFQEDVRHSIAAETAEVERRLEAIVAEFSLQGEFTKFLAQRVALLSVRLERLVLVDAAMIRAGLANTPSHLASREYEKQTQQSLLQMIKELRRFAAIQTPTTNKADVRWARYTQFRGVKAVEAAVVAPRPASPEPAEATKPIESKHRPVPRQIF